MSAKFTHHTGKPAKFEKWCILVTKNILIFDQRAGAFSKQKARRCGWMAVPMHALINPTRKQPGRFCNCMFAEPVASPEYAKTMKAILVYYFQSQTSFNSPG